MTINATRPSRGIAAVGKCALAALLVVCATASPSRADGWPDKVTGRYKVTFNGIEIGRFNFQSTADARGYSLTANAKLSVLLGAFKWSGVSSGSGSFRGSDPKPADYTFDFKANSKTGSVKMGFNSAGVADATVEPPAKIRKDTVPLQDKHMKGVLDPLSAVLALSRGRPGNPCGQTIEIFDGKQRFDLVLSPKGQRRIDEKKPSGEPETAYVCGVRYVPIAGHRDNKDSQKLAAMTGIEIALRPIPSANILVPYQVTVPTFGGNAVITSERVQITMGEKQIALFH